MAIEIQAPKTLLPFTHTDHFLKIFAGGSIEMGKAKHWQKQLVKAFKDYKNVAIFNPRRDDWNSSWKQTKNNKEFRKQVEWEIEALENSDIIIIYFDPGTISPISLLELGLFGSRTNHKCQVICPTGFWRKGNVDIVCEKFNIMQHKTLKGAIEYIKKIIII